MLADAIAGATRPSQTITWARISEGSAQSIPEDLTGATMSGKIQNNAGVTRSITGVLTVTDGPAGIFTWDYGTADVATAGTFSVQFTVTFSVAPLVARTLISQWIVQAILV